MLDIDLDDGPVNHPTAEVDDPDRHAGPGQAFVGPPSSYRFRVGTSIPPVYELPQAPFILASASKWARPPSISAATAAR